MIIRKNIIVFIFIFVIVITAIIGVVVINIKYVARIPAKK